jgi:uncharacterized protein (DUF486 family)
MSVIVRTVLLLTLSNIFMGRPLPHRRCVFPLPLCVGHLVIPA